MLQPNRSAPAALTVSKSVYFDDGKRRLKVLATLDVGLTEAVDRDRRSQP